MRRIGEANKTTIFHSMLAYFVSREGLPPSPHVVDHVGLVGGHGEAVHAQRAVPLLQVRVLQLRLHRDAVDRVDEVDVDDDVDDDFIVDIAVSVVIVAFVVIVDFVVIVVICVIVLVVHCWYCCY